MGDIVLRDVRHGGLHPLVPIQHDGVANGHLQQLGQLFRDNHPIVGQGDALIVQPVAQPNELGEAVQIVHGEHGGILGRAGA